MQTLVLQGLQPVLGVPACVSITWWPRPPPQVTYNLLPKAIGDPQGIPRCSRPSQCQLPSLVGSLLFLEETNLVVCVCVCVCVCLSRRQS